MSSSTGKLLTVTTFGESHGPCIGAVVDGCPPRMELGEDDIQPQLDRRRPGRSPLSTARSEGDLVRIVSGVQDGHTLGGPITLIIDNHDARPRDYAAQAESPRPSHADFTYHRKYGVTAASGGGRASARETAARVAAGAVAEKFLSTAHGVSILAWVSQVADCTAPEPDLDVLSRDTVDASAVRCADAPASERMCRLIEQAADEGDSLGGVVSCACLGVPAGWGEPVFDKTEALLAAAMLSIPAARGFEVGAGFSATRMRGSEHNDVFVRKGNTLGTATNRSGGVQGGITNGEPVTFNVAFKPTASIRKLQHSVNYSGEPVALELQGRHDPCVLPRAVPVVEAMAALVLADLALQNSR